MILCSSKIHSFYPQHCTVKLICAIQSELFGHFKATKAPLQPTAWKPFYKFIPCRLRKRLTSLFWDTFADWVKLFPWTSVIYRAFGAPDAFIDFHELSLSCSALPTFLLAHSLSRDVWKILPHHRFDLCFVTNRRALFYINCSMIP